MLIGVDLDSVLNNLNEVWINVYNEKYNDSLTLEDIKCWDMSKYVKCGNEIYNILDETHLENLQPQPYAIEVTKRISEKHKIFVVSASEYYNVPVKVRWLNKHFSHIKTENIIFCHDKSLLSGLDMLIDDGLHNITSFSRNVIVFDQRWNRDAPDFYPRAKNWLEIEQILSGFDF